MRQNLVRGIAMIAMLVSVSFLQSAKADILFNNGPIITHPGGMTGAVAGADRSAISPGGTTFGSGATGAFRLADDFTLSAPLSTINSFTFYGYLTGATAPGASALFVQIWNGDPSAGGSVIWGDTTTNVLTSTGWADSPSGLGIFRTTSTDTAGTTRRVQQLVAGGLNINLSPGTYWIDYNFTGVSFTPPVSDPTAHVLGNAQQWSGTAWGPAIDAGTGAGQIAVPFLVEGTAIPEPTAGLLLLVGAVAGFARRRRA
jgi:hypothetical protein